MSERQHGAEKKAGMSCSIDLGYRGRSPVEYMRIYSGNAGIFVPTCHAT